MVLGYQKLIQSRSAPIVVNQPIINQPVVNQPVVSQPSVNCLKEGEHGTVWFRELKQNKDREDGVCCAGLLAIDDSFPVEYPDNSFFCSQADGGLGAGFICAYCGNGVCGKGEHKCNCPQDCTQKLTLDVLKNIEYCPNIDFGGKCIKLVNGIYQPKPSSIEYTKIEDDYTAYGDLNNDEQEDAVVIIVEYGGGTGFFIDLVAVLNQNGKPLVVAMQYLGDRTAINSITIQSGVITVDMSPKGDPRKIVRYKLSGDKLKGL